MISYVKFILLIWNSGNLGYLDHIDNSGHCQRVISELTADGYALVQTVNLELYLFALVIDTWQFFESGVERVHRLLIDIFEFIAGETDVCVLQFNRCVEVFDIFGQRFKTLFGRLLVDQLRVRITTDSSLTRKNII